MERDYDFRLKNIAFPNFNSHAHVERDMTDIISKSKENYFNSHAHVERDGVTVYTVGINLLFQLTRSRGA